MSSRTVYLVWLREGEYGDSEVKVVRASLSGAKTWCNEHRKLQKADQIQWKDDEFGSAGVSSLTRKHTSIEFHYYLEPVPFGD